ncbi:MAG: helix-turn-helix domain-containing protein [Gemmatimonadota bacterium]
MAREGDLLSIGEASRLLGVSPSTLRRLEKDGRLAAYGVRVYHTPSRRRRYKRSEVVAALEASAGERKG